MFRSFELLEDTPPDIIHFEQLWLIVAVLRAVIQIALFDDTVLLFGPFAGALFEIVMFSGALVLMVYASRRRSNLARWLAAVGYGVIAVGYDLTHLPEIESKFLIGYVAVAQLAVQAVAVYYLFSPASRAWFAGLPQPDDD